MHDIVKPKKNQEAKLAEKVPIRVVGKEPTLPSQAPDSASKVSPIVPIAIILAGIIVASSVLFLGKKTDPQLEAKPPVLEKAENNFADPRLVSNDDHILGNPSAKVKIIEYSDLECEYCKTMHQTMHDIMDEYGKTGQVAWVYRQFPIAQLHSQAPTESEASECAAKLGGNVAFWKYIDSIFKITTSGNTLDLGKLPEVAGEIGLDVGAFNKCLSSGEMKPRVEADSKDAIDSGANGTPFMHIIGPASKVSVAGGQTYLTLKILINQALESALQ